MFRQEFYNIGEIRSLLPRRTNVTATANVTTCEIVMKNLEMAHTYITSKAHCIPCGSS